MKKLLIPACLLVLGGCAYVENRARDAADIITVAGEYPAVGVAASGAYVGFGVFGGRGRGFGLRSGAVGSYEFEEGLWLWTVFTKEISPSEFDRSRGKGYSYHFLARRPRGGWFNTGQVEVAVGLGPAVRAGVNFSEIADFVVGLAGADLCDDDIAQSPDSPAGDDTR